MKRKLFAVLLALCVVLTMSIPASVFAGSTPQDNAGMAKLSGPATILKDKSKDLYEIKYEAKYTMSKDIATEIETHKAQIAGAVDKDALKFCFIVKLDSALTAKGADGKYHYEFDTPLFVVDESGVKTTDEGLYVPCKLKDGWETTTYKEGDVFTLKASAFLPKENFKAGKTLKTTGKIRVELPDQLPVEVTDVNTVETKMMPNLSEKLEPGTAEIKGPERIQEDKNAKDYSVEYQAIYTMSEDIAEAIESYKDAIQGYADKDALQFGFNVKLDSRLDAKKDGKLKYTFDTPLFEVDESGIQVTADGLYVPCKLKDGWEKSEYTKGMTFTLTATVSLPAEKFEAGKKLETTGDIKVVLPNGEEVKVSDANTVYTEMKGAATLPADKYSFLLLKAVAKGKTSAVLTWTKVADADGYDVYRAKCNSKQSKEVLKLVKSTKGQKNTYTVKKLTYGISYKYRVDAYKMIDGEKKVIVKSVVVHSAAGNVKGKYTNAKSVTLKKSSKKLSLKVGKSATLKATTKKAIASKPLLVKGHTSLYRYLSSNPQVAKVSKTGKVKAVSKGSCKIYVIAVNGVYATSKVTVK